VCEPNNNNNNNNNIIILIDYILENLGELIPEKTLSRSIFVGITQYKISLIDFCR